MLRIRGWCFTWLVLGSLLACGAVQSSSPTGVPPPPEPGPSPYSAASLPVGQPSYGEPVASETITTNGNGQPAGGASLWSMAPDPDAGLGQYRSNLWQPFVGVEAVFLAPIHNAGGGGANYTFSDPSATSSYTASAGNGMVVAPRIWIGLMGPRWGVGFRYWSFANQPGGGQFPNNPTSQGVFSQGGLKLQTFDFETMRLFRFDDHQLWFSVGLRYAQFGRDSTVSASDVFNGGLYSASASSSTRLNGVGFTTSLYGLSPLGGSDWNLFYGGRVSYLSACDSSAFAQATASYVNNHAAASIFPAGSYGHGDALVGEFQLGVQYSRALQSFPANVFFRIGGEFQYWHVNNGSTASASANAGPLSGVALVTATSAAGNSNLALLGFGISTGLDVVNPAGRDVRCEPRAGRPIGSQPRLAIGETCTAATSVRLEIHSPWRIDFLARFLRPG